MHSTSFGGLLAAALIALPLAHGAAASPQYVTCDEIAKGAGVQPSGDGAGENWPAMAKVVCSSIERMRQMSSIETKAEQDEIHRLYQTAVDGRALRLRAVPSCVSQTVADVVFQGARLGPVATVLQTARCAQGVMRQNLALSIGYNLLMVPLAVAGFVTPWLAAAAMSSSSLLVLANSFRLQGRTR